MDEKLKKFAESCINEFNIKFSEILDRIDQILIGDFKNDDLKIFYVTRSNFGGTYNNQRIFKNLNEYFEYNPDIHISLVSGDIQILVRKPGDYNFNGKYVYLTIVGKPDLLEDTIYKVEQNDFWKHKFTFSWKMNLKTQIIEEGTDSRCISNYNCIHVIDEKDLNELLKLFKHDK